MVQVVVPDGAGPGQACNFVMPSGTTVQVVVPDGAGPGTVLEVADPGGAAASKAVAAPPTGAVLAVAHGEGEVLGIVANGHKSAVSGVQAVGPQDFPPGYDMLGDKYGILARPLAPNETFQSEPGAMVFMSQATAMSAKWGGVFKTVSQVISGEALVKVNYVNEGGQTGYVALTPNQPFSMVIPVSMPALPGGTLNVKRGAYLAGTPDITARAKLLPAKDALACACGGLPPIIQEITSETGHGQAFLSAAGTIVARPLRPGEEIIVDSMTIVGFENTVTFEVRNVGSFMNCCLGGEGCFNTVLTGPGNVYLQSINTDKLMSQLVTIQQEADNDEPGSGPAPETMRR